MWTRPRAASWQSCASWRRQARSCSPARARRARTLSDTATVAASAVGAEDVAGYSFEQLEPSPPLPRDASERLLANAIAESEQIRERAWTEGHAQGRADGHHEGHVQTTAAALAMGEALRELHELRAQMADELERDAVELALALAAKLLAGALDTQPERVIDVVRGALRRVA